MTKQTKIQILVALFLVWGGTAVFQYMDDAENSVTSLNNADPNNGLLNTAPGDLFLAKSFTSPRQSITLATPRNIFSPFNHRPPTQPPSKKAISPQTAITQPRKIQPKLIAPPGPSPIELATQRAEQQLREFRFLGYLKKGGESQAFLTKGQAIYIVKQGATVEGRILVNRIDPTLVVLSTQVLESGDMVKAEIPLTKDPQSS